mmetsp:Transcript_31814/g.93665  ORF Transcript_31814/g.93665 Transcript_31814/m.93665 type:complete len:486 (-) Transcript_31814:94-1551(-)
MRASRDHGARLHASLVNRRGLSRMRRHHHHRTRRLHAALSAAFSAAFSAAHPAALPAALATAHRWDCPRSLLLGRRQIDHKPGADESGGGAAARGQRANSNHTALPLWHRRGSSSRVARRQHAVRLRHQTSCLAPPPRLGRARAAPPSHRAAEEVEEARARDGEGEGERGEAGVDSDAQRWRESGGERQRGRQRRGGRRRGRRRRAVPGRRGPSRLGRADPKPAQAQHAALRLAAALGRRGSRLRRGGDGLWRVALSQAQLARHPVHPVLVRGVQRGVARLGVVHVEPGHVVRVVARAERQLDGEVGRAVEVERRRLHPRVVRVARVVDVAAVHLVPVCLGEEPAGEVLEALALALGHVARLLFKLAPQRHRDELTGIHHPARDGPLARVPPLDDDHLERRAWLVRTPPCDDRVGGVVWSPLAQPASITHPRPPHRVERPPQLVEPHRQPPLLVLVGAAPRNRFAVRLGRIRPAALFDCAVIFED